MLTTSIRAWAAAGYYAAADAGAFNASGDAGTFGAYCTFMMDAVMQDPGAVPVRRFLWGNSEDAVFSGWSLELEVVGDELVLQAKVGNGAAYVTVQEPITGPAVAATGQVPAMGPFERLIQASLWADDTNLILAVNGTICGVTALDAGVRVASTLPATLGAGTAAVADFPASNVRIVSCGYSTFPGLNVANNAASFIGNAYRSARQTGNSGYISQNGGIDWTHRYAAFSIGEGLVGGLTKTPQGATATLPIAPATLPDIGSAGRANLLLPAVTPVALNKQGAGDLFVDQEANADWLQMGTFFFTP